MEDERKSKLRPHITKVSNLGSTVINTGEEQKPQNKSVKPSQPFNLKSTLEAVQADLLNSRLRRYGPCHTSSWTNYIYNPIVYKDELCVGRVITALNVVPGIILPGGVENLGHRGTDGSCD